MVCCLPMDRDRIDRCSDFVWSFVEFMTARVDVEVSGGEVR